MATRDWNSLSLRRSTDQVSCDLQGETAILQLSSGVYYGLDPVSTRIWMLLAQPSHVGALIATIVAEFDVDPGRCAQDIAALLEDLEEHGLITVVPA
jgi:hypothetical protein